MRSGARHANTLWWRRRLWKISRYPRDCVRQLNAGLPRPAVQQLDLHARPDASMTTLLKQSPIEPIDGTSPDCCARRVNAHVMHCN
jgi:hypothetical protein